MAYYRSKLRLSLAHGGGADDATGGAGAAIDVAAESARIESSLRSDAVPAWPRRSGSARETCPS